jgi:hypothetical protein
LEHGFMRVQCNECHHEHLVAFSCKLCGFCPNCGARRMVESAALRYECRGYSTYSRVGVTRLLAEVALSDAP